MNALGIMCTLILFYKYALMLYKAADKIATTVIFYRQGLNFNGKTGILKPSIYSVSLMITQ